MVQPPGFQHPQYPNYLCKLKRSLCGLCQAPRQWFSRLVDALVQLGFVGSADSSLFIYRSHSHVIFFLIYVYDIIITGSDTQLVNNLITIHKEFAIKDLGNLSFLLGVEALHSADGLYLTQRKYIIYLLKRSKMDC